MIFYIFLCIIVLFSNALEIIQIKKEFRWDYINIKRDFHIVEEIGNYSFIINNDVNSRSLLEEDERVHTRKHIKRHITYHPTTTKIMVKSSIATPDDIFAYLNKNFIPGEIKLLKHVNHDDPFIFMIKVSDVKFINNTIYLLEHHPSILWIDYYHEIRAHNRDALPLVIGNSVSSHNFTASGQIISVFDTGVDINHCLFKSDILPYKATFNMFNRDEIVHTAENIKYNPLQKVKMYVATEYRDFDGQMKHTDFIDKANGHGTHVAGSAAGNSKQCENFKQRDSNAQLVIIDVEGEDSSKGLTIPYSITPLLQIAYAAGSRIFSNSWGSQGCGYSHYSMEMDKFMYTHDDVIILVANGNDGPSSFTVASPATFKNGISVGSSYNYYTSILKSSASFWDRPPANVDRFTGNMISGYSDENLSSFSSRGPTCDGRRKPDIVAPGEFILSSRAGTVNGLLWSMGTSMATPITANLVAVAREFIIKSLDIPSPSAALIKNVLITTSYPLKGRSVTVHESLENNKFFFTQATKSLDFLDQGYGRVNLDDLFNRKITLHDRIPIFPSSKPHKKCFRVNQNEHITIGLVWSDPESYPYADKVLINDINLQTITWRNSNIKFILHGNHGSVPDSFNNVERIKTTLDIDEIIEVIVSVDDIIVTKHDVRQQLYTLVHSSSMLETECPRECTPYEPVFHCITSSYIGEHACFDGKYTTSCLEKCNNGVIINDTCVCYHNEPCISNYNDTQVQFKQCRENTTCMNPITPQFQSYSKVGSERLLAALFSPSAINVTFWIGMQFVSIAFVISMYVVVNTIN